MTATKPQSRLTGAVAVMGAQGSVLILGYLTHLWIGRLLGPGPYGVYGVVLSLQSIFGLFLTLGVPVAIARYVARDEEHGHSILRQGARLQLLIALVVALIMGLGSPILAGLLGDPMLASLIAFSAIVIFSQAAYPIYQQFFSGMHMFNRQAAVTTLYAVIKAAGALSLIYVFGVFGAFAGFLIGGIAAAIIGWWWSRGLGGRKEKRLPRTAFLKFAGVYVLILVGLQILISLDLFMVKALLGDNVQAGYYNAGVTLSRIPYMLLQALGFILLPSVARLTKPGASADEAVTFIAQTIRYLILLIVPSVALAAATSKPLIHLFFSTQYTAAAPVLSVLMIGLGSLSFYLLLANIAAGANRALVSLGITVGLVIVSAGLGWYLIPTYGLIGAAWQTTITGLIGLAILATYTFRTFRIPVPWRSAVNAIVASAIAVGLTYFWIATPLTLIPQYLVVGVIYLTALWFLREIRDVDRTRLASMHPRLNWLKP
ncbi:hypothetical protein CL628_00770 [bacterium]|nr:hypothetical protein [bacterium]